MPLPAVMLAFLEKAGPLTGVVGSVADWAILASTIADHAKAQEGLKYNSHAFLIPQPSAPQPTPARRPSSAASPGQSGGKSAAVQAPPGTTGRTYVTNQEARPLLSIRNSTTTFSGVASAEAVFGVSVYYVTNATGGKDVLHLVHLTGIRGFATEVGDQAEVEFSGQAVAESEGGYLLSAKGIVNELFSGFFHFWCDFLVTVNPPSSIFGDSISSIRTLRHGLVGEGCRIERRFKDFLISF